MQPKLYRGAQIDAQGRVVGPWHTVDLRDDGGIAAGACSSDAAGLLFDAYELDLTTEDPVDGAANGGYDPCCLFSPPETISCSATFGSFRWFFVGTTFCANGVVDDFTVEPGCEGINAGRHNVAWYNGGGGGCERGLVALQIYDDFGACVEPAAASFLGGVIYEFFNCDSDADGTADALLQDPGGYYTAALEDCFIPGGLPMPADGSGAYELIFAQDLIDTNADGTLDTLVYSTCAQSMNWGDKVGMPGSFTAPYWMDYESCDPVPPAPATDCTTDFNADGTIGCDFDGDGTFEGIGDDNVPDGVYESECIECFANSVPCPATSGAAMLALWKYVLVNPTCADLGQICGDCDCDGDVDVFDIFKFSQALTNAAAWCASTPGCNRYCAADGDDDTDVDSFDIFNFVQALTAGGCPTPPTTPEDAPCGSGTP
jgi:hypothetical protein